VNMKKRGIGGGEKEFGTTIRAEGKNRTNKAKENRLGGGRKRDGERTTVKKDEKTSDDQGMGGGPRNGKVGVVVGREKRTGTMVEC